MTACIFCRIAKGDIPARKVYEDEQVVAFLDIAPLAKGHTLVIPKAHVERVEGLGDQQAKALFAAVHKLNGRLLKATGAAATTIAVNNGREAGQEVPHVHVHVVPRKAGDKAGPIHALAWERPKVPDKEQDELATSVRALP